MLTAKQIELNRKKLDNDIAYHWTIISKENVVPKGIKRNYDMKGVLQLIKSMADQRVKNKMLSIALNMGFKDPSKIPTGNIYPIIYKLSELNEIYVKLGKILKYHTINPKLKVKLGKKNMKVTEDLTSQWINIERGKLITKINALRKKLEDINSERTIDDSKPFVYMTADTVSADSVAMAA